MKPILQLLLITILLLLSSLNSYSQVGNYSIGRGSGSNITSGDFNTFVGDSTGHMVTSGSYLTLLGYQAGRNNTSAYENVFLGYQAGFSNTTSSDNTFIGFRAGFYNTRGDNTFIGNAAGFNNTNGGDNTFIGEKSGQRITTGSDNTFIGCHAGAAYIGTGSTTTATTNPATGSDNTSVGSSSGYKLTSGSRNAFFGNEAGYDNTLGSRNTFVGDSAGIDVGVGHHNTFIGQAAGSCTEHADYNTFVGSRAGWDNNRTNETNNANYNTYLGYRTGFTNREGQYNVMIGALTDFSSTAMGGNGNTNSYNIGIGYDALINGERVYSGVIGANARVSSNNSFVIGGTTSVTRMSVGIGTDTPNQNASLELAEVDKGFLITRMSDSERTSFGGALSASDAGMMVYDSISKLLNIWNGTQWAVSGIQNLALSSNTLSIADGNSIDLSSYLDNTDAQDLSLTGNTLALTNDATTIDLSTYLDNTDAQTVGFSGTNLSISNGNSVDLASLKDGYEANTDNQNLHLSGNSLSINGGNTVDLSGLTGNNNNQNLLLSGTTLSIDNGNQVDLVTVQDGFEANTDQQNLSGSLNGNTIKIDIDNGTSAQIDLSSLLEDIYEKIEEQANKIEELEAELVFLKEVHLNDKPTGTGSAQLFQNIPNPTKRNTKLSYYLPNNTINAQILISDSKGVRIKTISNLQNGKNTINFSTNNLSAGVYLYTLIVSGRKVSTKKMLVIRDYTE